MKQKILLSMLTVFILGTLCACSPTDDVKVISKDQATATQAPAATNHTEGAASQDEGDTATNPTATGYVFQAEVGNETVSLAVDIDFSTVIHALGEADSYFEAPSCAFQGIDKIYTYPHFEIQTYPEGDTDKVSMILLLDDLVATQEGLCIGMTQEDMETAYGKGYEIKNGAYVYRKDNMQLTIIITDGSIVSIAYESLVLAVD